MLRGEWWLIDSSLTFADGDIGDQNHEGVVFDYLYDEFRELLIAAGLMDLAQQLTRESEPTRLRTEICDWADSDQRRKLLTNEETDDVYAYICSKLQWPRERMTLLTSNDADLRHYGICTLGWTRIAANRVQTWRLDEQKLRTIVQALEEIADEEAILDDATFDLEDQSAGQLYSGVPWSTLQSYSLAELRYYGLRR